MGTLPEGWVETDIGALATYINGAIFKPTDWHENGMPIIRIQNLTDKNKPLNRTRKYIDNKYKIANGDLLFSWSATLDAFIWDGEDAWLNQHIFKVVPNLTIADKKFLFYLLREKVSELIASEHLHGSTMKHINRGPFLAHKIGLPPPNEQKRIVSKLDKLFARSHAARDELARIPCLIERYKQAIITSAMQDVASLSSKLSSICHSIADGDHQAPPKAKTGIPFITISAINDKKIRLSKATRYVPESYFDNLPDSRKPEIGDILLSVTGSIGIPAIVQEEQKFVFQRHIAIIKPDPVIVLTKYLFYALCSDNVRKQGLSIATGTAQLTIPLGGLRNFEIPVPPLNKQKEIVRRIEKAFTAIDAIAAQAAAAQRQLSHLEAQCLSKAFRGELVPQDPNDEPASILLERIARETGAAPKKKRNRQAKPEAA